MPSNDGTAWWVPLVSALIGAVSASITPIIKDLLLQRVNDKRLRAQQQQEIFRNYAAPLVFACERLLWRFGEVFVENRHGFLKKATLPLVFNEYKRKSTLYRIASLIGWIRAVNLELSALPRGAAGLLTPIATSIGKLQCALADGPHVELYRLEQICKTWDLDLKSIDNQKKRTIAHRLEMKLYSVAGDEFKFDSQTDAGISDERKLLICKELAEFLCNALSLGKIDEDIINESKNVAISRLAYREALIYRDWQDAIGDSMIALDPDSVRRFKVKGYEEFEAILEQKTLWMSVFRDSIIDIDYDRINMNDFRTSQLKEIANSVSEILLSLSTTADGDLVSPNAVDLANKILAVKV